MERKQVAAFVNEALKQAVGDAATLVSEDLSNSVAAGETLQNAEGVEQFIKTLPDVIGKQVVANKTFEDPDGIDITVDGFEYGSILEKIRVGLPEAEENQSWQLVNGRAYDEDVFEGPTANATFWNSQTTFEVRMCKTDKQVKSAFQTPASLAAFVAGIDTQIRNALMIYTTNLKKRVINNQIAETVYQETSGGTISNRTGEKAVNLLYEYNQQFGTSLTATACITNADFLKFCALRLGEYGKYIRTPSRLFNLAGEVNCATAESLRFVMLDKFAKAIGPYSLAPAYNETYLKMPEGKTVVCWQGTEDDLAFSALSTVKVSQTAQGHAATVTGVIAVMFDKEACVVANDNARVTSKYNAAAEFTKEWHKNDASYLVDNYEPFVVFYVA